MVWSRAERSRALLAWAALAAGCGGATVQHHVPVVAATALLNLETSERCDYIAIAYANEPDAVVALKNFAGAQGGTLVLGLDRELLEDAERDDETGVFASHVDGAAGKVVRCPEDVQRELITRARMVDTR